jgi:hypothetical protein
MQRGWTVFIFREFARSSIAGCGRHRTLRAGELYVSRDTGIEFCFGGMGEAASDSFFFAGPELVGRRVAGCTRFLGNGGLWVAFEWVITAKEGV